MGLFSRVPLRTVLPGLSLILLLGPALAEQLTPGAQDAWHEYIRQIEPQIERQNRDSAKFLWLEQDADRKKKVRAGEVVIESIQVPEIQDAMIQHWVGGVFIPGATLKKVLSVDQDYARHKILYRPDVADSRILSRNGDTFNVYLRFYKQKVLTAVIDTECTVTYQMLDKNRAASRSVSTSVREVKNAGDKDEKVLPPGEGFGFMWAINSYWRLAEQDGGVYAECDAVTLSRDVPFGAGKVVGPIIRSLAADSIVRTLTTKRKAVEATP